MKEWYLEYRIQHNRPGILGDVASILGMLGVNIVTVNGIENKYRAFLLQSSNDEKIMLFEQLLKNMDHIHVKALRPPTLLDRLVIRHGRYINRATDDSKTFRFNRDDLGLLVDFMGEIFKRDGRQLIGVRGMPRVGKTEAIIAASVNANKRWLLISSTLIRQTMRERIPANELEDSDQVFIIDGVVSSKRANEEHQQVVRKIMRTENTIVVEHPDIFVQNSNYSLDEFTCIIELRNDPDEVISYDTLTSGFNSFDIS